MPRTSLPSTAVGQLRSIRHTIHSPCPLLSVCFAPRVTCVRGRERCKQLRRSMSSLPLTDRFNQALQGLIDPARESGVVHLVVAASGGLDSTVLLHLLRFRSTAFPLQLTVAHFD